MDEKIILERTCFFNSFFQPVFDNIADAEAERDKWNTGIIVDLDNNNKTVPVIRSFDDEERRRARVREEMNRDDGTSTSKDAT